MNSGSSKQKIIQSIREATNILVAVSVNPSVDELSAALGLTIFLNKLDKHATAVFSGDLPPVMDFLKPNETFEETTDSLRDFIIALDKEKADHLRYKVVDDAVKIFITPYKTTISERDLEFSQGDFNVELVLALNVSDSDHIDKALTAHGRILHDALVATITAGDVKSGLGAVDWHNGSVSGVSEMMVEIVDELKTSKVMPDEQIATALLTGVVAATDRFSNSMTSSRVMTVAAELMSAGANQQLVVSKVAEESARREASANMSETKPEPTTELRRENVELRRYDGSLSITHERRGGLDEVARQVNRENQEASTRLAQEKLARYELHPDPRPASANAPGSLPEVAPKDVSTSAGAGVAPEIDKPSIGGTLNATTEQAAEDKRRELDGSQNKTILKHGEYIGSQNALTFEESPLNAVMSSVSDEPPSVDPFAGKTPSSATSSAEAVSSRKAESIMDEINQEVNKLKASDPGGADDDRAAAIIETSAIPAKGPSAQALDTQRTPTLADIESRALQSGQPSATDLPPMPDFSTLPPLPPMPTAVNAQPAPVVVEAAQQMAVDNFNPSQFKIPGQK